MLIINIRIDDEQKRCEIWVENSEKATYKLNEEYIKTIDKFKKLKYSISIFIGGNKPLLPIITSLLDAQTFT